MSVEGVTARPSLLRNRNFMLLWSGQLVSWVGTEVTGITLPLVVLALTGSPARAGLVAAVRGAIYVLLALPAGALVDRWDRRRVMVLANTGSGLAMGSICAALFLGRLTLAQLYIAGAVEGACFVFANLARFAALIRVVPREQYVAARVQTSMADYIALLLGPPLGGFLYQVAGAGVALLADACSYAVNALSIYFITVPLQEPADRAPTTLEAEMRAGLRWLWGQRALRHLNILVGGRTAITSGLYLLIIVLARRDRASSTIIGVIFALSAVGGILGAVLAGRLHHRYHARTLLVATTALTWLIVSSYAGATDVVLLAAVTAALYAVGPLFEITAAAYSASVVPDALRGRISSLLRLVELGAYALGLAVTGALLQSVGSTWTIVSLSAAMCALTLFAVLNPLFRAL